MERRCMGCMEPEVAGTEICPHCGHQYGIGAKEACHMQPESILAARYIIGKVLGFGGFGVTYIAWDALLEQKVAIKEYLPSEFATRMPHQETVTVFSGEKEEQFISGLDRFIDEAKKLAKFHAIPGIVRIFDSFKLNNTAYIVMEYLSGESLKEKIEREGKIPVDESLNIIMPILEALKEVHKEGILHRDIAPDNIYLPKEGGVKLLDFGAARYATTTHSKSLSVIIKPGYAPEEQYRSRGDQGSWTDVYALAATFYKMLTGITPEDAMERAAKDTLKEPSKLGIEMDKNVENALMNGLNVKIQDRTQSAEAFQKELWDVEAKRNLVKQTREDVGHWPLWARIAASGVGTVIVIFMIMISAGVIKIQAPKIMVSNNEDIVRIPNLVNSEIETGKLEAEKAGIDFQIAGKEFSTEVPEGIIISQSIGTGEMRDYGTVVEVVVSAGYQKLYVPDMTNLSETEAVNELVEIGLLSEVQEEEGVQAPGYIIRHSPDANKLAMTGDTISLYVSTGKTTIGSNAEVVIIPSLVGLDFEAAMELLLVEELYLAQTDVIYDSSFPEGQIIYQMQEAGTEVLQGTIIEVTVNGGVRKVRVPDVQYDSYDAAIAILEELGLVVEVKYQYDNSVPVNGVITQNIESGRQVEEGSKVVLTISQGREEPMTPKSSDESSASMPTTKASESTTSGTIANETTLVETTTSLDTSSANKSTEASSDGNNSSKESAASWSEWIRKEPGDYSFYYDYEAKEQYRYRKGSIQVSKQTTTSNQNYLGNSWVLDESKTEETYGSYGSWSNWSTNRREILPEEIDFIEEREKTETSKGQEIIEYNYSHYRMWVEDEIDEDDEDMSALAGYWVYSATMKAGYQFYESGWGDKLVGESYEGQSGYRDSKSGYIYFNETTRTMEDESIEETYYSYRERTVEYVYHFYREEEDIKWGKWSEWIDGEPSDYEGNAEAMEFDYRTVYRYLR